MSPTKCCVMFSGGACSFLAAVRAVERFGAENTTLLFSDTQMEDGDLYRFLREGALLLGANLVELQTVPMFDLIRQHKSIPNSQMAFCSSELKVIPAQKWIQDHPHDVLVFGITWVEMHRLERIRARWASHSCWFPLTEPATMFDGNHLQVCRDMGIEPPRLYDLGFAHNNCGGTCIRGGQGAWKFAYQAFPERVGAWAALEDEISELHGKPCTILRDRRGGTTTPLPLREFMKRCDEQPTLVDDFDIGGCGCFVDELPTTTEAQDL